MDIAYKSLDSTDGRMLKAKAYVGVAYYLCEEQDPIIHDHNSGDLTLASIDYFFFTQARVWGAAYQISVDDVEEVLRKLDVGEVGYVRMQTKFYPKCSKTE